MPLSTTVAALVQDRRYGLAINGQIERIQAQQPQVAQAFTSIQNAVNDIYRAIAQETQITEFTVTDPITGERIAWIGGQAVGNISYSGAAFARLWVGPNADPATAPFFSNGSQVIIGKNGQVFIQDLGQNTVGWLGVTQESPQAITAATNASPVVVTITAHGYINGDTIIVAGATGNTAINGYRIVQNVTANTFTMTTLAGAAVNGNGAYAGTATATRYYAGLLTQTIAIGESFANYKLRAFADGSLRIRDASITLTTNGSTITISDELIPGVVAPGVDVRDDVNLWHAAHTANHFVIFDPTGTAIADMFLNAASGNSGEIILQNPAQTVSATVDGATGSITLRTGSGAQQATLSSTVFSINPGAMPADSQIAMQANSLGGLEMLCFSADSCRIGFDMIRQGGVNIAKDTSAAMLLKSGAKLAVYGATGLTVGGVAALTQRVTIDLFSGFAGFGGKTNPGFEVDVTGDVNVSGVFRKAGASGLSVTRSFGTSLTVNTIATAVAGTPGAGQANFTAVTGVTLNLTSNGFAGGILTS